MANADSAWLNVSALWDLIKILVTALVAYYLTRRHENAKFDRELDRLSKEKADAEAKRPQLKVAFEPRHKECHFQWSYDKPRPLSSTTQTIRSETLTDCYVNLLVFNSGGSTARECVGKILDVYREQAGQWPRLASAAQYQLEWSFDRSPIDIMPKSFESLNFLLGSAQSGTTGLRIRSGVPLALQQQLQDGVSYKFRIGVNSSNADTAFTTIELTWRDRYADWQPSDVRLAPDPVGDIPTTFSP